jgi:hypothetical protein
VFARPVQFRARDGATVNKLLVRRNYQVLDRAIHNHYWPPGWSEAIPDIEYLVDVKSPNRMLHEQLWKEIEQLLESNMARRKQTCFDDDGEILRLTKYSHRDKRETVYELTDLGRTLYLKLTDEVRVDSLPFELGVAEAELEAALDYLSQESLIVRDADRVMATINPNVTELELSPLITTVENRRDPPVEERAQCSA